MTPKFEQTTPRPVEVPVKVEEAVEVLSTVIHDVPMDEPAITVTEGPVEVMSTEIFAVPEDLTITITESVEVLA